MQWNLICVYPGGNKLWRRRRRRRIMNAKEWALAQ